MCENDGSSYFKNIFPIFFFQQTPLSSPQTVLPRIIFSNLFPHISRKIENQSSLSVSTLFHRNEHYKAKQKYPFPLIILAAMSIFYNTFFPPFVSYQKYCISILMENYDVTEHIKLLFTLIITTTLIKFNVTVMKTELRVCQFVIKYW